MKLLGLVLAGGKSNRMGKDKGLLSYHQDSSQRCVVKELLTPLCHQVFLSLNKNQLDGLPDSEAQNILIDQFENIGPLGGIVSAFAHDDSAHWLIVPIDQPNLNAGILKPLIESHASGSHITCYEHSSGEVEPFPSIFSPGMAAALKMALSENQLSVKKLIRRSTSAMTLQIGRYDRGTDPFLNINSEEERKNFLSD